MGIDSDESGTEWDPASAESDEDDEEMDVEEEEPDASIKRRGEKQSEKKQKKGLAVRERINKAATEIALEELPGKKRRIAAEPV